MAQPQAQRVTATVRATNGSSQPVSFGGNVSESKYAKTAKPVSVMRDSLPPVVVVFDTKGSTSPKKPRLALVKNGVILPILQGDSTCLKEYDLESLSQTNKTGCYVAGSSLGDVHVFQLELVDGTSFEADHIAKGKLPIPTNESDHYKDTNRTNIEAMRCFTNDTGTLMVAWAGRGGSGYANQETKDHVWFRMAPFDTKTATVDTDQMTETTLANVCPNLHWRAISCLDVSDNFMYFTAAYDGEAQGHELNLQERTSRENQIALQSLVARASMKTGQVEILLRLDGLKLEAVTCVDDDHKDGTITLLLGSDDEGLGSLVGSVTFKKDTMELVGRMPQFHDIGVVSSFYDVDQKRWGTSGMALFEVAERKEKLMSA